MYNSVTFHYRTLHAALNDYSYKEDPGKVHDSRWLHRAVFDWERAANRYDTSTDEGQIFTELKKLIAIRSGSDIFRTGMHTGIIECCEPAVYSFAKIQ